MLLFTYSAAGARSFGENIDIEYGHGLAESTESAVEQVASYFEEQRGYSPDSVDVKEISLEEIKRIVKKMELSE